MKKSLMTISIGAIYALAMLACNDSEPSVKAKPSVQLTENPTFSKILTDKNGQTLYYFSKDTKGTSACTGGCVSIWPVFYDASLTVSEGLSPGDFSTITRADGAMQTTYKGFPLYYFHEDLQPGDTNGEKVNNVWYVAKPDYSIFYKQAQLVGHDGNAYTVVNYSPADYEVGAGETPYLSDANGRTLYTFKNDKNGVSNYAGNPAVWPVFYTDLSKIVVPSILDKADFAEIMTNGVKQLTYKGWPLYYFGGNPGGTPPVTGDSNPGDTRGISFPMPDVWPIANTMTTTAPN
jgi:predicted lipoprotein with Yx(FWY)xxD motif